ncbi:ATP synthase epsilon chain [Buchnera aphidicola (Pemphigus populi)]
MTCQLNIVSVEKSIFSGLVKKIQISGSEGELGIYPGHAPLLTFIKPGYIYFLNHLDKEEYVYISSGILEVQPSIITVLADIAVRALDLDYNLIIEEKQQAEKNIKKDKSDFYNKKMIKELTEALAKLRIIQMMKRIK